MKEWVSDGGNIIVTEIKGEGDLHNFEIRYKSELMAVIEPETIEDMISTINEFDNEIYLTSETWEDSSGETWVMVLINDWSEEE